MVLGRERGGAVVEKVKGVRLGMIGGFASGLLIMEGSTAPTGLSGNNPAFWRWPASLGTHSAISKISPGV